jgi:hypothetical protein
MRRLLVAWFIVTRANRTYEPYESAARLDESYPMHHVLDSMHSRVVR